MVTFKTVCRDGQIVAVSNAVDDDRVSDDGASVCSDFMDLDSEQEDYEHARVTIDLTLELECEGCTQKETLPQFVDETETTEMDVTLAMDVPIADYASEECVQTLPRSPVRCTNVDIDRCVGVLLANEYQRQRTVRIMDRESILDLQAKSCALEELSNVSNEVVVGPDSDSEPIPLSKNSVDKVRASAGAPKVSRHMLSFQASTTTTTIAKSNPRFVCNSAASQ